MNLDSETREYLTEVLEEIILELANISVETYTDNALQQAIQTELQRLYETAEFCGFDTLRHVVSWMQANLQVLQKESELLQQYNADGNFYLWLELLTVALNDTDPIVHLELKSVLQEEVWLLPIEPLALQGLLDTLPHDTENAIDDSSNSDSLQTSYDLSWDEDVHPELLEAFLIETPDQVIQTSNLIRQISTGSAKQTVHQQAARLAHTIKGSSAVIGLEAVATFAYRLEAILEYSIEQSLPSIVSNLLVNAADCLEALFESLLTETTPPPEYPILLEQLTECTQQIAKGLLVAESLETLKNITTVSSQTTDNSLASESSYELAWDEDVHPELLEAYLSETPEHVVDIAHLLRKISTSEVDTEDYRKASRLAHTIKGTSAVVGVHAVADFTHKLEDILDYVIDNPFPLALVPILEESADLLESLYDSLLSEGTPPTEYPALDQQLSDWQQRIKQGLPDTEAVRNSTIDTEPETVVIDNETIEPEKSTKKPTSSSASQFDEDEKATLEQDSAYKPIFKIDLPPLQDILPIAVPPLTQAKPKRTVNLNEVSLRIPLSVLEKLLNVSSELMTVNTQMSDQIQHLLSDRQSMNERNERIRSMLDELEWAVDRQATSSNKQLYNKLHHTNFDALEMDSYNELHSITGLLSESVDDDRQISVSLTQQLRELKSHLQGQYRLNRELNSTVLDMRMEPVKTLLPRLERIVRETARKTAKQVNFVVKGEDLAIDTDVLKGLADPLLHLLRNAIDHGIETPEQREQLGKPSTGEIVLTFTQKGDQVVLSLQDDGAGICPDTIYQKALKTGLVDPDEVLSEQDKLRLILKAGFSTRDTITEVSGRGVGMDVVNSALKTMSGHMHIQSEKNQGTEMHLQLPLTLVAANALLVQASDNIVAIPSTSISQIYYLVKDSAEYRDKQWFVTVQDQKLALQPLSHLLGWPVRAFDATINQSILILENQNKLYAIYIDEVLHSQEIILKSLKPWMDNVSGVNGVCLLRKGVVAPVLDIATLLKTTPTFNYAQLNEGEQQLNSQSEVSQILVVDDSLSNRKALSLMIEPLGYEVLTAVDGSDALQKLEDNSIQLVITDLEMPNMNGLEMVEFMRSEPTMQHLPIIMVTSRSTVKHRKLARQAGVDAYLTKPVDNETLTSHIDHYFNNNKENSLSTALS